MKQAKDFLEESNQIFNLMKNRPEKDFFIRTQFKNWSINDVIGHLHLFNFAADLSIKSPDDFQRFFSPIRDTLNNGKNILEPQGSWLEGLSGHKLLETWWIQAKKVAKSFGKVNPKLRVKWAGPEMSARSSITARQMETWAHGQEIFDILGKVRTESDRIKNIVHLGVSTFGWTFLNRGLRLPNETPFIQLESPSGIIWNWNDPATSSTISGKAVEFASVVTQTRNIKDTSLKFVGSSASQWLSIAQCFAGPPKDPPKPGTRRITFL